VKGKPIEIYEQEGLTTPEFVAQLYSRYGRKLYAYAIKNWNVTEDQSWDLVYKTLYKVIDSYKNYKFENEEKFAAFIFKVFINYLRNHYRDHKKQNEKLQVAEISPVELQNRADSDRPDNSRSNGDGTDAPADPRLAALTEELEKMEDWQRMLLLMRSEGRPYSEIARYVQKPEEQLKVYYQRLKEAITKKMYERI
jgi:RNA polymerase sigma-70 factor (ECF subfamily)